MKYRIKSGRFHPILKFTTYIPQRRYGGIKWLLGWCSGEEEFSEEHALDAIEDWKEEEEEFNRYKEVK